MLSSCNLNRKSSNALPVELIQAENIMYENPDSALQLLQGMAVPADKEAHATWALLLTQAKYKCFVDQSDSLLNIAYDYFMQGNNAHRMALTLYHKAVLYKEQNQLDKALPYYLQASEEIKLTEDYRLAYLIYSHIGIIYAHRNLHGYSIQYCEKANEYALLSDDSYYITESYNSLARAYSAQKDYHKAIMFYDKALGTVGSNTRIKIFILQEKLGLYIRLNDYDIAQSIVDELKQFKLSTEGFQVLGHFYMKLNQQDSAYVYLNKALVTKNIYTLSNVYKLLYTYSKNRNDVAKIVEYSDEVLKINDSINKIDRNKALIEMQEKYNQQKVINEKNQAERNGLIILCVSIILIAIIIVCYQLKVLCQKKELEANREELNRLISRLNENKQTIAKNIARIEELEKTKEDSDEQQKSIEEMQRQNDSLGKENKGLQNKIDEYAATMAAKSKELENLHALSEMNLYLHKRELFLCAELLRKDEIVNKLKKHPKALDAVQWEETIGRTNRIYDNYTIRLRNQIPELTENDIRICCLIKLSFSNVEIASILGISSASVSRQKLRLKERITQKVGPLEKNLTLDLWLKEY